MLFRGEKSGGVVKCRCLVRLFISLTVVSEFRVHLDSGYHAVNSGFQLLKSESLVSGTWPPDSNR